MKASVWGLLVAALAFGASTIYLSVQLRNERAQADKVTETMTALNARIAELEKARDRRLIASGTFGGGTFGAGVMPVGPPLPPAETHETKAGATETVTLGSPAPRSEAFDKMMRSNLRASNKRMYSGLGEKLGLNQEDTNKVINMLTDQQLEGFERTRDQSTTDPAELRRQMDEARRESQAEIDNFLGASKAAALRDYQESIPARLELDQLARQLEGADATLSDDQQKRMLAALIEERKRVPLPQFSENAPPEDYAKAYAEWQADYNERINAQAHSILTTEQMTAYTDYQQWQKEMQQQLALRRPGPSSAPI